MSCPSISTLSEATFQNVCLITGVSSNLPILSALSTCCGDENVHKTTDYCFSYCNITVAADVESWANCLGNNIDQSDLKLLEVGCVADFKTAKSTASAAIATTWPALQLVETVLSSGSVVRAMTVGGQVTTTQVSLSTRTSTATIQAVSSTPTPTSSKTASGSLEGKRVSGMMIMVGLLSCLSTMVR